MSMLPPPPPDNDQSQDVGKQGSTFSMLPPPPPDFPDNSKAKVLSNLRTMPDITADQAAQDMHLGRELDMPPDMVGMDRREAQKLFDENKLLDAIGSRHDVLRWFGKDPYHVALARDDAQSIAKTSDALEAFKGQSIQTAPKLSLGQRLWSWWEDAWGVKERRKTQAYVQYVEKNMGLEPGQGREVMGGISEVPEQVISKFFNAASFGLVPDMAGEALTTAGVVGGSVGNLAGFIAGPAKSATWLLGKAAEGAALVAPNATKAIGEALTKQASDSFFMRLGKDIAAQAPHLGLATMLSHTSNALQQDTVGDALVSEGKALLGGMGTGAAFAAAGRLAPWQNFSGWAARATAASVLTDATSGKYPFEDLAHFDQLSNNQKVEALVNYGMNAFFTLRGDGGVAGGWIKRNPVIKQMERFERENAENAVKAGDAAKNYEVLQNLGAIASETKLRERVPDAYKNLIASLTEDADVKELHVDGALFQEAMDKTGLTADQLEASMPDVAKGLGEAVATKGDVTIPLADYLTHVVGTPMEGEILPHVKVDPEGMTYAEGQDFYQTQQDAMVKAAEKLNAVKQQDAEYQQQVQAVRDSITKQLTATGVYSDAVSKEYAKLPLAFMQTTAHRLGISPLEFYQKWGAKIVGDHVERSVGDGTFHSEQIRQADEALRSDATAFAGEVDKIKASGAAPSQNTIMLKQTPLVLRLLGKDALTGKQAGEGGLHVSPHTFENALTGEHGVTLDMLKQIPEAMADPIAIFDSATKKTEGDVVFMLELKDKSGKTVVAPVAIEAKGRHGQEINIVKSAYGKGGKKPSSQWFVDQAKENARYVNGQKFESWKEGSGVQFSSGYSNAHGNTVHTEADLVKLREANPALYQYAGERSNMSEPVRAGLTEAQRLAGTGADNEAVRKQTGWFKSMDGQWRYEIPDRLDKIDLRAMADEGGAMLGDIYNNPELYAAYPELRDIWVEHIPSMNALGGYDGTFISLKSLSNKKTLLHEIQHAIQEREGFAKGGNQKEASKHVGALESEKNMLLIEGEAHELLREYNNLADSDASRLTGEEKKQLLQITEELATKHKEAFARFRELKRQLKGGAAYNDFDAYKSLAGEVEARDTAGRGGLTEKQRSAKAPDLRDDAIVMFGDKQVASLSMDEARAFSQTNARGSVDFSNPERTLVRLFQTADLSTIPHESAHIFLDTLMRVVADDGMQARALYESRIAEGMDQTKAQKIYDRHLEGIEQAKADLQTLREFAEEQRRNLPDREDGTRYEHVPMDVAAFSSVPARWTPPARTAYSAARVQSPPP